MHLRGMAGDVTLGKLGKTERYIEGPCAVAGCRFATGRRGPLGSAIDCESESRKVDRPGWDGDTAEAAEPNGVGRKGGGR